MSLIRKHSRLLLVAVCCVAAGAGASLIASAGAKTKSSSHAARAGSKRSRGGALKRFTTRAVQGSVVVHTKKGFTTVTFERGKVDSVSGQQLTITEGTPKASYKTVTLTVPSTAVVRDDRQKATLSDLKSGQRVVVLAGPKRTLVVARTARAG